MGLIGTYALTLPEIDIKKDVVTSLGTIAKIVRDHAFILG